MNVCSMHGLGDNIYQRAVLNSCSATVYLDTPWPQLYLDLPHVRLVEVKTKLRTQMKNVMRNIRVQYHAYPMSDPILHMRYTGGNILQDMGKCVGLKAVRMDLPTFDWESPIAVPYVVVRPPTLRKEWNSAARNPLPQYIDQAARAAKAAGYLVVSVADIEEGKEWIVGDPPYADIRYHRGELLVEQLLSLVQNAAGVIGGVGWIVPACLAYKTPAFIIYGGWGYFNDPVKLMPEGPTPWMRNVLPDNFCRCKTAEHDCDKRISNLQVESWIRSLTR